MRSVGFGAVRVRTLEMAGAGVGAITCGYRDSEGKHDAIVKARLI